MIFGIGVMLITLGICNAIGLGAKVKDTKCPTPDEELAVMGRIISIILITAAGVCLLCIN